jgi:ArsR family transcriptional regulator
MSEMTYDKSPDLEAAAAVLAALGHPVRLRIAAGLLAGDCCVGPMTTCLGLPQPLVSRHLAVLREAGVVEVVPEGRQRRYRVVHPAVPGIVAALLGPEAVGAFPGAAGA